MKDLIFEAIGLLIPGAGFLGVWGILLKLATRFGLGWIAAAATSGPLLAFLGKVAESLVNLGIWLVKGVVGYAGTRIAGGLDHITKNVWSFAILMAVAWGAYQVGGWGRPAPIPPPPAQSAPSAAAPKPRAAERGFFDEVDCFFKGGC